MTVSEATGLFQYLSTLRSVPGPPKEPAKFHYALTRNMAKIRTAMRDISRNNPIDQEKEAEYETKRLKLLEEYSVKGEDGKSLIVDGEYQGLEDNEEFRKKLDDLNVEFKDFIDLKKKVYSTELKIDFFKVLPEYLPPSFLSDDIDPILFMIREQ